MFKVLIDDNFHYGDESERVTLGEFATLDEAVRATQQVVDEYLATAYTSGMDAGALMSSYLMFGEDPFIVNTDPDSPRVGFSARDYARTRCADLCARSSDGGQ